MKTSVRFLSMLLAVLMIASAALTASAADAETTANSEALQLLVDLGIIGGYDDGSLQPEKLVERDEMAKIIFVLYTKFTDAGAGVISFKDVAADNWAAGYISWCSSKGIVGGYGDGTFGPDNNVTYDQALKMVCGALGYTDWDSKFWPTDVRTKALNELELGENITGVKGGDFVTRAQVAQIVYNALFADMNETKKVPFDLNGIEINIPKAKTLAVDIWGFAEINASVVATEKVGFSKVEEDEICLEWVEKKDGKSETKTATYELADIGLEEYKDKDAELFGANVRIIYDSTKSKIDEESVIATSVTITGEKDVTITYNDKKDEILLAGEEIDDEKVVNLITFSNGLASAKALTKADIPAEDSLYTSIAYDYDSDGEYDAVYWEYLAAYEVKSATEKKVSVAYFGESIPTSIAVENIKSASALAEDDVVVAANIYGEFNVIAKVAATVDKAVKYSATKLTLAEAGEVAINKTVFQPNGLCMVSDSVMKLNEKGETVAATYYIYDGKVFGLTDVEDDSELQFAVISYFNEATKPVLNEDTMQYDISYTAVVYIDGKQQTVNVNPDDSIDSLKMNDDAEKAEILDKYGKAFISADGTIGSTGKYLYNRYILASYTVDEDGYYTFKTNATHEDYVVYPAGHVVKYNKRTKLYNIEDADGNLITNRVKLADSALIYYTYQKESTGKFTYLGTYTKETLPADFESVASSSAIYATYDKDTNFYTVRLMVVDEEAIEIAKEKAADFRTDAREFFYCYQTSNQVMASDGKNLNYSNFMRDVAGANLGEVVNEERTKSEGSKGTTQGDLYYWDDEVKDYFSFRSSSLAELGIKSIGYYEITDIIGECIIAEGVDGVKYYDDDAKNKYLEGAVVDANTSIWTLGGTAASCVTLTFADLQKSFDIAREFGEFKELEAPQNVEAIIGTSIDENGEEYISVLIIQQYVYNSAGDPARNTTTLMNNFKK